FPPRWLRVTEPGLRDGLRETLRQSSRRVTSGHRVDPRELPLFNTPNPDFSHFSSHLHDKNPNPPSPSSVARKYSTNSINFISIVLSK
ncbi:hypothetical protein HAX54_021800, partial [Datura stramonium]|nr:hypothetical protein [Datura stramonium]